MEKPRILVLGAHPDDADLKAGGTCAKWIEHGFTVLLVSVTDGGAGHQSMPRAELVKRRRAEAAAAGSVIGAEYRVLDFPDGSLMPTLEAREKLLRLIREFRPQLIVTHRPVDYHPDHRYTAQLVQDAAYLVTVPAICPDVRHLDHNPVILYFSDSFNRPYPFQPHLVVDIGPQFDRIVDMLDCHESQFYEWLPFNSSITESVPNDRIARKVWLAERFRERICPLAERFRDSLIKTYGQEIGGKVLYVEAFEISEYGSQIEGPERSALFPFLPAVNERTKEKRFWADVNVAG